MFMEKDPVCGMEVQQGPTAHTIEYRGENYLFCSRTCKESFEQDPEKYLGREAGCKEGPKVVIVGTGNVGATFAFSLMISGVANHIVLINRERERAEGHMMDLNHGLSFVQPSRIYVGEFEDCRDADVVVVTAGANQRPGESRLDLVRRNTEIFREIIPQISRYNPGILLIVSNPVDILTYVALKLSGMPMNRVFGSGTSLDSARFRYLLSRHCSVDPRNVNAFIIGEHGDSEVPVWSKVSIAGVSFREYCPLCERQCSDVEKEEIFQEVKNAAYEIIKRKGSTYFAIGLALVRIVGSIIRDENSVLTVSSLVDDYYGVSDLSLSIPVILNRNGISKILKMDLNPKEIRAFQSSAGILKGILNEIEF
jgi:L-lactate dehydrogenase